MYRRVVTDDDRLGDALVEPPLLDDWADPEDRLTAVLLDDVVSPEGRTYKAGDRTTPRDARRIGARFRVVKHDGTRARK